MKESLCSLNEKFFFYFIKYCRSCLALICFVLAIVILQRFNKTNMLITCIVGTANDPTTAKHKHFTRFVLIVSDMLCYSALLFATLRFSWSSWTVFFSRTETYRHLHNCFIRCTGVLKYLLPRLNILLNTYMATISVQHCHLFSIYY